MAAGTIVHIEGRVLTVKDTTGQESTYEVNRAATITLDGQRARIGQLLQGDSVIVGGITLRGVMSLEVTRGKKTPSILASTSTPPIDGDRELRNQGE